MDMGWTAVAETRPLGFNLGRELEQFFLFQRRTLSWGDDSSALSV